MFGLVMADTKELKPEETARYQAVYCGLCRRIRKQCSQSARLGLSYDMAFLALLHSSLYEPEETSGNRACLFHPIKPRSWADNEYIRYSADMNVALAYYKALDDWQDEKKLTAGLFSRKLKKHYPRIAREYPRQCQAIADCIAQLSELEARNCSNPDLPADCFGKLMAELFVVTEDHWAEPLRKMGHALGRFVYLADAVLDYRDDCEKKRYNPFIAMGGEADFEKWKEYLVMTMGRCTRYYESLPLVQDKTILDNILYGGIWLRIKQGKEGNHDEGSL